MRERGVVGHIMTDPEITGPENEGSYALFVRRDGLMFMVHFDGIAYLVSPTRTWKWNDRGWGNPKEYTPADLIAAAEGAEQVDLADWVRTFGARLESNFYQIYTEMTREVNE